MKNGSFECSQRYIGGTFKIIIFNGVIKVHTLDRAVYLRTITKEYYKSHFEVIRTLKSTNSYNIAYFINGIQKSVIQLNGSYTLAIWKIGQLKNTGTYKIGKLIPIKI